MPEDLSKQEKTPEQLLEESDRNYVDNLIKNGRIQEHDRTALLNLIRTRRDLSKSLRGVNIDEIKKASAHPLTQEAQRLSELIQEPRISEEGRAKAKELIRKALTSEKSTHQRLVEIELESMASTGLTIFADRFENAFPAGEGKNDVPKSKIYKILADTYDDLPKLFNLARQRVPIFPLQALESLREAPTTPNPKED